MRHGTRRRNTHLGVMWVWQVPTNSGWSPTEPCCMAYADRGNPATLRAVEVVGPRASKSHCGKATRNWGGGSHGHDIPLVIPPFLDYHLALFLCFNSLPA